MSYAFDNDSPHSLDQHATLAALLDPITTARLCRVGVGPGWRCLEIGAGGGTIAHWLADQVGDLGHVLATDINTRYLTGRPNLTVRRHDITTDELPERAFDLVHARLVLIHLPQRHEILHRLRYALKPGGRIVLEEFDCTYAPVLEVPKGADPGAFPTFNDAVIAHLTAGGADVAWGRHAHAALGVAGYTGREVEIHLSPWRTGSPGYELHYSNTRHLRDGLLRHGATDQGLEELRTQLRAPGFTVAGYPVYSVSGRAA